MHLHHPRTLWLVLLALGLLLGGPIGCQDEVAEPGTEISALMAAPNAYLGTPLILSGEVDAVWQPGVFTLQDPDDASRNLTVISTVAALPLVKDDDLVQVTGELRLFRWAEIEREVDWELDPTIEVEIEGAPVFVAREVRKYGED